MRLISLGSSSKGNCHLLETDNSQLMLDAGVKYQRILNYFQENGHERLKGILITHAHG